MTVAIRQSIEKAICKKFVEDALAHGKRLAVSLERGYDIDEMLLGSTDPAAILDAMLAGDECHVFVQAADGPTLEDGEVVSEGWVYFVMGDMIETLSINGYVEFGGPSETCKYNHYRLTDAGRKELDRLILLEHISPRSMGK